MPSSMIGSESSLSPVRVPFPQGGFQSLSQSPGLTGLFAIKIGNSLRTITISQ